jgi:hypothetical protein
MALMMTHGSQLKDYSKNRIFKTYSYFLHYDMNKLSFVITGIVKMQLGIL